MGGGGTGEGESDSVANRLELYDFALVVCSTLVCQLIVSFRATNINTILHLAILYFILAWFRNGNLLSSLIKGVI